MLNVARFNDQLRRMGQAMTWARATACPCRDPHSGGASASCPVCRARGVVWEPPVPSRAGLSGMKAQREWANFGQWESGDVVVSVGSDTPLYAAGENDRVVFLDSSQSFDFVQLRGSQTEWRAFTPDGAGPVLLDAGELTVTAAAPARPMLTAISFDRCFWLDSTGSAIVEGGLPVQSPDGALSWPAGQLEPPAGRQYSLRGRKLPEYFMFKDFSQDRAHYGGLALPRRLVLRKYDLFGR